MPIVTKSRIRRRKKNTEPDYYYAYVGSVYHENIKGIDKLLIERGIKADKWASCNGMVEYRIPANMVHLCPDFSIYSNVAGTHKTKGFPYLIGTAEIPIYLYAEDRTYYLKDSSNPWTPVVQDISSKQIRRRRRGRKQA